MSSRSPYPSIPPKNGGLLWVVLALLAAVSLWACIWAGQTPFPRGRETVYVYLNGARWPNSPIFATPGVPAKPNLFDLQVLLWGLDTYRAGGNPDKQAGGDIAYTYNYPNSWRTLRYFGTLEETQAIALAQTALFLGLALLAARPRTAVASLCFVCLILAPPTVEALAMSNNDLLIFSVMVSCALIASRGLVGFGAAVALLSASAALKLYPIASLPALLKGTRGRFIAVVACGLAVCAFFFSQRADLAYVAKATPKPHALAFGSQVLTSRLLDGATRHGAARHFLESAGGYDRLSRLLPVLTEIFCLAVLATCAWKGFRREPLAYPKPHTFASVAFRLGTSAYLMAFLIGHNWMHREIFLILTVPWLLETRGRRWIVATTVAVAWLAGVPTGPVYLATQLATWALAGALAYWAAYELSPDVAGILSSFRPGSNHAGEGRTSP